MSYRETVYIVTKFGICLLNCNNMLWNVCSSKIKVNDLISEPWRAFHFPGKYNFRVFAAKRKDCCMVRLARLCNPLPKLRALHILSVDVCLVHHQFYETHSYILENYRFLGSFYTFWSMCFLLCRSGEGPSNEAPRAALGSVCGSESHPGFHQQPGVQQAADTLLPRLVRHRQELCGPDHRRQPVSRRGEERVCPTVHCPIPLPTCQTGGHIQGGMVCPCWHRLWHCLLWMYCKCSWVPHLLSQVFNLCFVIQRKNDNSLDGWFLEPGVCPTRWQMPAWSHLT